MKEVTALRLREVARQDVDTIAEIYRNLGAPTAERVVTQAFAELAQALSDIAERVRAQDLRDLAADLGRFRRRAENLGLITLAAVAGDARASLERADGTAFAAVWARLARVAELSLASDHGITDLSG